MDSNLAEGHQDCFIPNSCRSKIAACLGATPRGPHSGRSKHLLMTGIHVLGGKRGVSSSMMRRIADLAENVIVPFSMSNGIKLSARYRTSLESSV